MAPSFDYHAHVVSVLPKTERPMRIFGSSITHDVHTSPASATTATTQQRLMSTYRRNRIHQSISKKLDIDSAFFWLLLAFFITTLTFLSIRDYHSLDSVQLAEYERRTQYLSNSSVYIVEATREETLLSKLNAKEWKRISGDIDLVAIVFDDLPLFLTDDWISAAEQALDGKSVQMALFKCGCVLPNRYFTMHDIRLDNHECIMLPGFVLNDSDIKWIHVNEGRQCRGRDSIINSQGTSEKWSTQLAEIKRVLAQPNATQPSSNADGSSGVNGNVTAQASA